MADEPKNTEDHVLLIMTDKWAKRIGLWCAAIIGLSTVIYSVFAFIATYSESIADNWMIWLPVTLYLLGMVYLSLPICFTRFTNYLIPPWIIVVAAQMVFRFGLTPLGTDSKVMTAYIGWWWVLGLWITVWYIATLEVQKHYVVSMINPLAERINGLTVAINHVAQWIVVRDQQQPTASQVIEQTPPSIPPPQDVTTKTPQ